MALFSNTYLAMRVAFFNEMDSFSQLKGMNSKKLLKVFVWMKELVMDIIIRLWIWRLLSSKGYQQLDEDFWDIPNPLISSIPDSNLARAKILSDCISEDKPNYIGIYRLIMKKIVIISDPHLF